MSNIALEEKIFNLATRIDEFTYQHDTYGYNDVVDNREKNVKNIYNDLSTDNRIFILDYLDDIIDNEAYSSDEELKTIKDLIIDIIDLV